MDNRAIHNKIHKKDFREPENNNSTKIITKRTIIKNTKKVK